jgi:hypothetical protein
MSARTIVMPSNPESAEQQTSALLLRDPGSTQSALAGAEPAADTQSGLDDSEELRNDLLRRLETAYPLPWRHGGLNE